MIEIVLIIALIAVGLAYLVSLARDRSQGEDEGGTRSPNTKDDGSISAVVGFMDAEQIGVRKFLERRFKVIEPGQFFIRIPFFHSIVVTDARVQNPVIEPITFTVQDRVTVTIGFVLRLRVVDPLIALIEIDGYLEAAVAEAGLLIQRLCAEHDFLEEAFDQEGLSASLPQEFGPTAHALGIQVETFGINELIHAEEIRRGVAQVALAKLDAQRNIIRSGNLGEVYSMIVETIRAKHPSLPEEQVSELAVAIHGHNAGEDSSAGMMLGI